MSKKEKSMHEFYASYGIEIDEFIDGFDEVGFKYFYENVIRKIGNKPDIKLDIIEGKIVFELAKIEITKKLFSYKLIHVFEGLEITLYYTMSRDINHKICNIYVNYTLNGIKDFIDSNFYCDLESVCDELLERLKCNNL